MTLDQLQPSQSGRIAAVLAEGPVGQRLMDLGVLPRTEVRLERVAPTGEPYWVRLGGSQIALRRSEARAIRLEATASSDDSGPGSSPAPHTEGRDLR